MKKFIGIILIIAGGIWILFSFLMLISSFSDGSGAIVFTLILVAMGVGILLLGLKLFKNKKGKKVKKKNEIFDEDGGSKLAETKSEENGKLTLKDIRELVNQKVSQVPKSDIQATVNQLVQNLLGLNGDKVPFDINVAEKKGVDLIANWRLADARYIGMLGMSKHSIQEEFKIHIKLDEEKGLVKCLDKLKSKSSSFGFGGGGMEYSSFSGKAVGSKKQVAFGRKSDGTIGKVYDISLDTTILQNAIKDVVEKSGWKYKKATKL